MALNTKIKILVCDDQPVIRNILRRSLLDIGITDVVEGEDGHEAMEFLAKAAESEKPFDVVFMDWNMPRKNGFQVLEFCRAHEKLKKIPFIMITAERDKAQIMKALAAGVSDYIVKPFSAAIIISKLKRIKVYNHAA